MTGPWSEVKTDGYKSTSFSNLWWVGRYVGNIPDHISLANRSVLRTAQLVPQHAILTSFALLLPFTWRPSFPRPLLGVQWTGYSLIPWMIVLNFFWKFYSRDEALVEKVRDSVCVHVEWRKRTGRGARCIYRRTCRWRFRTGGRAQING